MESQHYYRISGMENGLRLESRVLEERIQKAVESGNRHLEIEAFGQHGLGGRLWKAGEEPVHVRILGSPGQRVGSMGFPNTRIEVMGPTSDDVGWLNGGAEIIIHGNAANGSANAMAQGKVYIAGNIGARGMTMTKRNPRFDPPELWVLGFGGRLFRRIHGRRHCGRLRLPASGSRKCARASPLRRDGRRPDLLSRAPSGLQPDRRQAHPHFQRRLGMAGQQPQNLSRRHQPSAALQTACRSHPVAAPGGAIAPGKRLPSRGSPCKDFHQDVWDRELGRGGLIGDLVEFDRSPIPVIVNGNLRRYVPVWENRQYVPPCEASCPTGIPVHERWRLIREGRVDEAVDLALAYTPFPASICGYLCPNLCMQGCTRHTVNILPVDVTQLGKGEYQSKNPCTTAP